jgi:HEPN domain-containing protein
VNRAALQAISRVRLGDARVLLQSGNYEGAYYLCGYVIECGLKACIAKQTKRYDFPDRKTVADSYTHDLARLVRISELELALNREIQADGVFSRYWTVVKDWSEDSRYQRRTAQEARDLYEAVSDRRHGVLRWIRRHW